MIITQHTRLHTGDTIEYAGQRCPVLSVNESSALVQIHQPVREFDTRFGQRVTIRPRPTLVRISPNSVVPILARASA